MTLPAPPKPWMSLGKTSPSRNRIQVAVSASRNAMNSMGVAKICPVTYSRARRRSMLFMGSRPKASPWLAKPSLTVRCVRSIIRTLRLRPKSRALTTVLRPEVASMDTTTHVATPTRTWPALMYQWASRVASRTPACFMLHNKVTRQILWFSLLSAFPIMIDNTLSVSVCKVGIMMIFPENMQCLFLLNSDYILMYLYC